ncbi:threonine--tRNA ligase [Clostridia bacterium]|nr:threonine--tRNA ligase [Clostridia bacterium]
MIKIKLKSGDVKEFPGAVTAAEVAASLGAGLAKAACLALVDGVPCDLRTVITGDADVEILTFESGVPAQKAFRHSAAHVLAQAVKRLFPEASLAIGPAVDGGFYYDFDVEKPFTPEQLSEIEAEMKKIVKENLPIERFTLPPDEAIRLIESWNEPYKLELCREHSDKGEEISFYKQGEFVDLCAGPHLMTTGGIKAVKLTSATGAYWRGSEKNAMLSRIYGTAFPKASLLDEHLLQMEEAKKRDHNKLGRELEFFTTSPLIGQGLPILLPKGAKVIQLLSRFVEDEEEKRGWSLTKTPFMAKSDLYKLSGHWDHYKDGMFVLGDESTDPEVYALRPMTCPFQYQAYLNRKRSYRDLPLRYNETSTLFRNEASGEMHGLIRVRQFTISEGHLICTPAQLEKEFRDCLNLSIFMLKTLGLYDDVSYRFSKRDAGESEKYIGTRAQWDEAENLMGRILDDIGLKYETGLDEAAFYGPKLDIQIKNVFGKEDTLITLQIDMLLAEKFSMTYTDSDGGEKFPYIIHRTSIGCYERTLALLIEKYAGALPLWISPGQVIILPIADRHNDFCFSLRSQLQNAGIRAEVDTRSEKIGFKIREAQLEKTPYMLIIGDNEQESGKVSVRHRKDGDIGTLTAEELIEKLRAEIDSREIK